MIKLLCRLYDPTEGQILMDGVNIKEYDYEQYMSVFAPVFQDFKLFSFSAKDNLVRKDKITKEEENSIIVILKKVGVYEKLASLKNGINTTIFKHFDEEGIEPGGPVAVGKVHAFLLESTQAANARTPDYANAVFV